MPPNNNQPQPGSPQPGQDIPNPAVVPQVQPGAAMPQPQTPAAPQTYPNQPVPYDYEEQEQYGPPPLKPLPAQPTTKEEFDSSRYDFFLKEQARRKAIPGLRVPQRAGMSKFMLALYGGGALVIVLVFFAIVMSVARSGKSAPTGYLAAIKTQQEIIRISGGTDTHLTATTLRDYNATAAITMPSAQQQLITYYSKHGGHVDTKALAKYTDTSDDQSLTAAATAGTYDSAYKSIMRHLLDEYSGEIKQAAAITTSQEGRALLDSQDKSSQLLVTMLNAE
jgi:hypothetical protein